jgi:hypothetical protein
MYFCIMGALLCLPPHNPGYAFAYAAYAAPILQQERLSIPAYANPFPSVVIPYTDSPGTLIEPDGSRHGPAVYRRS